MSQVWKRSLSSRAAIAALIVLAALVTGGRTLHADEPEVFDAPALETPVYYEPGDANLVIPRASSLTGPRTPTSNITITYVEAYPANAQAALEAAVAIIEEMVVSDIPIQLEAHWQNLGAGVLGTGGPYLVSSASLPVANTWFPATLANEILGVDIAGVTPVNNPLGAEMKLTMNSGWLTWHYGPGAAPSNTVDFTTVALHELTHALGLTGSMKQVSGQPTQATWGNGTRPYLYDQFTQRGSGSPLKLIDMELVLVPSVPLMNALKGQNGGVFFTGTNANAANGGVKVPLYAPNVWETGSSYSHLAESFNGTVNTLMTYAVQGNETVHEVGPVVRGILKDFGYTLQAAGSGPVATQLAFIAHPLNGVSDVTLGAQPVVQVRDANGAVVTSSTATVTLALVQAGGTLSCTGGLFKAAVAGVATFSGCKVTGAGTGYTVRATSPGLTQATSNAFNITSQSYDATCNTIIDATDALAVMRSIAGYVSGILPIAPCTGNSDGVGGLTLGDVLEIRRYVAAID